MSKKKHAPPPFSAGLSAAWQLMDDALKDYIWSWERVHRTEQMTQDYLHKLAETLEVTVDELLETYPISALQ